MTISKILESAERYAAEALTHEKLARERRIAASAAYREAGEKIKAGDTTSDNLKDYLLASYTSLVHLSRYEAVNALLKGKTGELVLGHYEQKEVTRYRMMGGHEYGWFRKFACGILTGDQLRVERGERWRLVMPVSCFVTQDMADSGRNEPIKGTFGEHNHHFIAQGFDIGKFLQQLPNGGTIDPGQAFQTVVAGDKEVKKTFSDPRVAGAPFQLDFEQVEERLRLTLTTESAG